jgi:uncharacterized protein
MPHDADYWIRTLELTGHPEGGFYREVYRSPERIAGAHLPGRFSGDRALSTAIYFLLRGCDQSALHRLRADEVWHFYGGSPLTLHMLTSTAEPSTVHLGPRPERGETFQAVVKAGSWFGATVDDPASFSLVGCTVAPGFGFEDFELGDRMALLGLYPQHRLLIERLAKA